MRGFFAALRMTDKTRDPMTDKTRNSVFHSFSTVLGIFWGFPGLPGAAEAGSLVWLRLGAQLLHVVHGSCL